MKKKVLSLVLTLAMCLGLSVPAFAAETPHDVDFFKVPEVQEEWSHLMDDSSLILNGVIGQEAYHNMDIDGILFDVVVGGGFTLNMSYPEGKLRTYAIYPDSVIENGVWDTMYSDERMEAWFGPDWEQWFGNDKSMGQYSAQSQYVFTCPEKLMSTPGNELVYRFLVYWNESDPTLDYNNPGMAEFFLRVNPAPAPANVAYASTQTVNVDGKPVEFQMYALKDANGNDTNYIKLRDLAQVLNGTAAQFEVGWNGAVNIETGKAYTANGSEMNTPFSGNRAYENATATTNVNGSAANLSAFILKDDNGGAYTYYQLRDLGKTLGFNVGWSADKGIFVETDRPYSGN